jgi:hypothetical protein
MKNFIYKSGLDLYFFIPKFMRAPFHFLKKHNNRCTRGHNQYDFNNKTLRERVKIASRECLTRYGGSSDLHEYNTYTV